MNRKIRRKRIIELARITHDFRYNYHKLIFDAKDIDENQVPDTIKFL